MQVGAASLTLVGLVGRSCALDGAKGIHMLVPVHDFVFHLNVSVSPGPRLKARSWGGSKCAIRHVGPAMTVV